MFRRLFGPMCFIFLFTCIAGCSSVLTYLGPPKSELADGETYVGDFAEYDYEIDAENDVLHFTKVPMCKELVQKVRVIQKQRRGVYLAVLELPFFGLGLLDMLRSYAIVEESRRVEPVARYFSGKLVPCDGRKPAAHETVLIKDDAKDIDIKTQTNAEGVIDLKTVLPEGVGPVILDIYPESDPEQVMNHKYPAEAFYD